MSWLTRTHPDYDAAADRLSFTLAHYTSDVYEHVGAVAEPLATAASFEARAGDGLRPTPFLHRHQQGESAAAYAERRLISTYTPHFAFIVDSLAGQLFAAEGDAQRRWALPGTETPGPLGDPDDAGSIMARLWEDADGAGTNWETLWMGLASRLVAYRRWGVYVEGVRPPSEDAPGREARVCFVDPRDVLDWHESGGRLAWVKIRESATADRTPEEDAEATETYLVLTTTGWQRWRVVDGSESLDEEGAYAYYADAARTVPVVPFRWAAVPVSRDLGYAVAKDANALMNLQSVRDWRLWTGCVNRLHLTTDQSVKDVVEAMKAGSSLIVTSGEGARAEYIHPSPEPAQAADQILTRRTEELYRVAYRSYADAARQATATEIAQDVAAGVEAFLVLCAAAMDEAENWAFSLLEQTHAPDRAAEWGAAYITRTRSFQPVLPDKLADGLRSRYFDGSPVPVGESAVRQAAARIAELDSLEPDPDELAAAVADYVERPAPGGRILTPRQAERTQTAADPLDALEGMAAGVAERATA